MESSQQELNVPLHRATSQEALHELVADGSKGDVQQHTRDEFASAPESPLETRSTLVSTATADAASQTDPVMLTGEDRAGAQAGPDERAHSGSSFPLSEMESQTQTAIKEALDAIHRARDQLQGATPDMQVILDTRNVREGCLEFLKRKPAYMLAYWDKEDEYEFQRRMGAYAKKIPRAVQRALDRPEGYKHLRTTFLWDYVGDFDICCSGRDHSDG